MKTNRVLNDRDISEIENIIGYTFKNKKLLAQCFTLSSASPQNNERLEWFGDAVVDFCVSELLFLKSKEDEGGMTALRSEFVKDAVLRPAVERLNLQKYLVYSGTKQNVGDKPVASLFEALAGGIYVDGGMTKAKKFIVEKLVKPQAEKLFKIKPVNFKGVLQEYLQSKGLLRAEYVLKDKSGPDHKPTFTVCATAQGYSVCGTGSSKAKAEQAAAQKLLEKLRNG